MNPLEWHPVVIASGFILIYLFLGGVAWGIVRNDAAVGRAGDENVNDAVLASIFWPIALVFWIIYCVASAGPKLVKFIRGRRRDRMIPNAKVVKRGS